MSKIMTALVTATVAVVFALVMTKPGRDIDAATQRFMLYYAGVFALIGLTASVGVGLVATDRTVMTPGHRVMAQAVHRAVSFGALAFLVIHIVTEILAQRAHVIDAVIPFLSPYRTFYIGLGTIASDLILLIVVTSIFRKRFTAHGQAWRWRAIHYSSYLAFVFGVLHGLLGGRAAKPYVDWSYGVAIAVTALALMVRALAISLRPKESVSAHPGADRASGGVGYPGSSPLRTAALGMAQAQLGATIQVLPGATGTHAAIGMPGGQPWAEIPAPGWSASSGPFPALSASPVYSGESQFGAYQDAELMPLAAPVYGNGIAGGTKGYPYAASDPPRPALTGPAAGGQVLYEPEYDGPPRFMGAPRKHVPQDDVSSYPYGPHDHRQSGTRGPDLGGSRPQPGQMAAASGPRPSQQAQPGQPDWTVGPTAPASTGPMRRLVAGPVPRAPGGGTGPMPRADSGPMPGPGTGPMPRAGTGPMPSPGTGPMPSPGTGPMPRAATGPLPRLDAGPVPRAATGPMPRPGTGPMPRADTGPTPRTGTGPMPRLGTGPVSRADTGPMPRASAGPLPRADSGPMPRLGTRPGPRTDSGTAPRSGTGSVPRSGTGPNLPPPLGPEQRANSGPPPGTGPRPRPDSRDGPPPDPRPRPAGRRARRADSTDPRYRDIPGRTGGSGWA